MKKTGFTLVELVITITILVILSTIAFVSFQSYTQDSRDANRLSTLNEIEKGLTLSYGKNGSYPSPQNATTYTGGSLSITQGMITQQILPELQSDPKDPLSKSSYTYSTTSDGQYFQIASDIENTDVLSQTTPQKTYAKVSSALVLGDYNFDPSLPSLIVIPTTSLTNSGIFSPDNCFVTNGGPNTIGNTTCTTKKQIGLTKVDARLAGYWDMETLTGTQLLDLSGNGNNGVFSGGMLYNTSLTGALQGKGLFFNGVSNFVQTLSNTSLKNPYQTVSVLVNMESQQRFHFGVGSGTSGIYYVVSELNGEVRYFYGLNGASRKFISAPGVYLETKKYYMLTISFDGKYMKIFVNGKNVATQFIEGTLTIPTTELLQIGNAYNSYYTNGIIDEVKIYNRALSDKEIEQQAKILGF